MRTVAIVIAAIVIGLAAAFGGGYLYGQSKANAKCEQRITKIQNESFTARQMAQKDAEIRSLKAELVDQQKNSQIEVIKTQVVEKIVQAPPVKVEVKTDGEVIYMPYTFDHDVIRLLNEARVDEANRDTADSDGGSEAIADVGVEELVTNDLEVVRLYHELANRYRTLQTYIRDQIRDGYELCKVATD